MISITPGRQRKLQRIAHLVGAAVLFAYVYVPLGTELEGVVRFGIFPLVTVTGILMWQAPRIRRVLRAARGPAPSRSFRRV